VELTTAKSEMEARAWETSHKGSIQFHGRLSTKRIAFLKCVKGDLQNQSKNDPKKRVTPGNWKEKPAGIQQLGTPWAHALLARVNRWESRL